MNGGIESPHPYMIKSREVVEKKRSEVLYMQAKVALVSFGCG